MTVMANEVFASGYVVGTGAALNVSIGWVPRFVRVINLTDGDVINEAVLDKMIAFTSGGTNTPVAGQTITGITSGATAKIKQVILISGTFAGGNAAGYFVCDASDVVGTFQSENVTLNSSASGTDDATVAAQVELGVATTTAVASVTGNSGLTSYKGDSSNAPGFTLGSTVSESAKLLHWQAFR